MLAITYSNQKKGTVIYQKEKKNNDKDISKGFVTMPIVNPNAAGIDLGSRSHFVCVGQGENEVREFGVFTDDLLAIVEYLRENGKTSVALESTGFYWKVVFIMLQMHNFEVILVNARHIKNVKGRKTDVVDARWIQLLHSLGLLPASFQPDVFTDTLKVYARQRRLLIRDSCQYENRMNKSLTLMNLRLKNVLSSLTGVSGRAIIEAILSGERDADVLASLARQGCKLPREEFVRALRGSFHESHLFELRQNYEMWKMLKQKEQECEMEMKKILAEEIKSLEKDGLVPKEMFNYKVSKQVSNKCPDKEFAKAAYILSGGIDLMKIDGVNTSTILTLLSETGLSLTAFPTAKNFCSWLGLAPNNKITGGRVISSHVERKKHLLAEAFRSAANTVSQRKDAFPLKSFFNRMAIKKGRGAAITATARKIATIIWVMLSKKVQYDRTKKPDVIEEKQKALKRIQRMMKNYSIDFSELNFN